MAETAKGTMGWEFFIPLILQYGLPTAERLWQKWSTGTPPTQGDWDELKALSNQMALDRLKLGLAQAGIDPNSEQGRILIGLVSGTAVVPSLPPAQPPTP